MNQKNALTVDAKRNEGVVIDQLIFAVVVIVGLVIPT